MIVALTQRHVGGAHTRASRGRRAQNGAMDLSNIDPQFTSETIPQSLVGESNFKVDVEIDDTFSGFSYTATDAFEGDDKE